MTLVRSEMSIGIVVAEAVRRARLLAAARPLEFEIDVADGLPRVNGDEGRFTQALSALIWYSARSGEPTVSSGGTVLPVQLKAKPSAGSKGEPRVLIEIEAPKSPIPPDELASLLSSETGGAGRRRYGGLTLGLGLARSLVELHGGSLTVRGTTRGTPVFDVSLPAA
jgi:signal transduction histidine kinase